MTNGIYSNQPLQPGTKELELFLSVTIKAIPPESFWKMGCGEDNLFSKRCLPRRAILQRPRLGTQKKHSLGGVPFCRF